MNRNLSGKLAAGGRRSRGEIIPALLRCASFKEMVVVTGEVEARLYLPFRLIVATTEEVAIFENDGTTLQSARHQLEQPMIFTSSGLGDAVVEDCRRELFNTLFEKPSAAVQDAFHRHQWKDRPHVSVCMSRADARTVSYTVMSVEAVRGRMSYFADAPDLPVTPEVVTLEMGEPAWK